MHVKQLFLIKFIIQIYARNNSIFRNSYLVLRCHATHLTLYDSPKRIPLWIPLMSSSPQYDTLSRPHKRLMDNFLFELSFVWTDTSPTYESEKLYLNLQIFPRVNRLDTTPHLIHLLKRPKSSIKISCTKVSVSTCSNNNNNNNKKKFFQTLSSIHYPSLETLHSFRFF